MSASDIPSISKRKNNAFDGRDSQGLVDLSGVIKPSNAYSTISSILQKKSDVGGFADTSRHTIESQDNGNGTTSLSIVKRPKVPASQAVAIVSAQKMVSISDISTTSRNKGISTVSKNKNVSPFGDTTIQDAQYREMVDDVFSGGFRSGDSKSNGFRAKKAKNINVTRQRSELPEMQAISLQKQKTRSQIAKSPAKQQHWGDDTLARIDNTVDRYITNPARVVDGTIGYVGDTIKKGMRKQAKEIKDDFSYTLETNRLARATRDDYYNKQKEIENGIKRTNKIEKAKQEGIYYAKTTALDRTVDRAKKVQKAGNTAIKAVAPVVVGTLKTLDAAVELFGNSAVGKNINRNAEAEYRHLRSAGRRARGSIVGSSNKGTLVKQHSIGTNNYTPVNAGVTLFGVTARYERGIANRVELHFYYKGQRVKHDHINYILTRQQINQLKKAAKNAILGQPVQANVASSTPVQPNTAVNKPAFNGGTRKNLNQPKTATRSGLVHRNKSGVV